MTVKVSVKHILNVSFTAFDKVGVGKYMAFPQ